MALRIRLQRWGKKKQPSYRIVVAERSAPRDGKFVEIVGFYNPLTSPSTVQFKEERLKYWLAQGAVPSETVSGLIKTLGLLPQNNKEEV